MPLKMATVNQSRPSLPELIARETNIDAVWAAAFVREARH
jgi:hypothetical protein